MTYQPSEDCAMERRTDVALIVETGDGTDKQTRGGYGDGSVEVVTIFVRRDKNGQDQE